MGGPSGPVFGAAPGMMSGSPVLAAAGAKKPGFLASWQVLSGGAVVCALIAAGIMFVMPDMAIGVIAGIAAGIGLVLSVVLALIARPKIIHAVGAVAIGLVGGAAGGAGMWFFTHPTLHVDNAGKDAIKIYVDGKSVLSVAANSNNTVNVHKGSHTLGWSKDGETKPTGTVKADLSPTKAHLYNPNKTACYWLVVDTYGKASASSTAWGPQPLQEFYAFDTVDNWFSDNPQSVTINTKREKGKVKVALQRAVACMAFANCQTSVRDKFIDCQRKAIAADNEDAFNACDTTAAAECKPGSGGDSAPAPDASSSAKAPTTPTPPAKTPTTAPKTTATAPKTSPTQPKPPTKK